MPPIESSDFFTLTQSFRFDSYMFDFSYREVSLSHVIYTSGIASFRDALGELQASEAVAGEYIGNSNRTEEKEEETPGFIKTVTAGASRTANSGLIDDFPRLVFPRMALPE